MTFRKYISALALIVAVAAAAAPKAHKSPLVVAQDGTGDYTTIQEAVYAVRDYTPIPVIIEVRNGVYREKLVIPSWKCNITIVGESVEGTVITWDDYAGKPLAYFGDDLAAMGTFCTHTVLVAGHRVTLENLTIENTAGRVGQAVALHTEGDEIIVRRCRLLGNQDTVFTGDERSHVYFDNCYICGTTDFIFGPAVCWFEHCHIHSLSDSYITAASTASDQPYGYVFNDCDLTAADGVAKVYLGRPWRAYAAVVFMHCRLGAHIVAAGWNNWRDAANERTARYAEYACSGPGADRMARVDWARELAPGQAALYTRSRVLGGDWYMRGQETVAVVAMDYAEPILAGGGSVSYIPRAVIYKMNGDYADYVPVTLSADGKTIISYPAPSDVSKASRPVKLDDGYWLDHRGIGEGTCFTSYTYAEYASLKQTPSPSDIMKRLKPEARVTEIVQLPVAVSQATPQYCNQLINAGLPGCNVVVSAPTTIRLKK
ncbi:MAG: hypothetical protein K2M76_01360 [Muribaculaceae bacterium]|nr:hypothetical protein [Muribaculaceae bacterium]